VRLRGTIDESRRRLNPRFGVRPVTDSAYPRYPIRVRPGAPETGPQMPSRAARSERT
jgi:hypothetical protein